MPTESIEHILPEELQQIVESVFETMLSMEARPCDTPWRPGPDRLTGVIHLAGDWNGAVLLECDHAQARIFAGRFLSTEPQETMDDVVRDVLGELTNMIGGNLKCTLTRGIRLSMPSVIEGSDYALRVCRAEVRDRIAVRCEAGDSG